jgi:hypothetical protein
MGRTLRILLPCALGLIAALLVSCGDTSHLIPGTDADAINQNIDAAASASGDGRCGRADAAVQRAQTHVQQLPSSVDPKLKADLEQGLARLRATAASECADNQQTETTATTESTASTASTESTATTESTASTASTASTETQNTETQNTDTSGTDTTGGNGNNGNGNGNGGGTDNGQGQGGGNGGTSAP